MIALAVDLVVGDGQSFEAEQADQGGLNDGLFRLALGGGHFGEAAVDDVVQVDFQGCPSPVSLANRSPIVVCP